MTILWAWKHHLSEHFEKGEEKKITCVGSGGTIFLDFDEMADYLK